MFYHPNVRYIESPEDRFWGIHYTAIFSMSWLDFRGDSFLYRPSNFSSLPSLNRRGKECIFSHSDENYLYFSNLKETVSLLKQDEWYEAVAEYYEYLAAFETSFKEDRNIFITMREYSVNSDGEKTLLREKDVARVGSLHDARYALMYHGTLRAEKLYARRQERYRYDNYPLEVIGIDDIQIKSSEFSLLTQKYMMGQSGKNSRATSEKYLTKFIINRQEAGVSSSIRNNVQTQTPEVGQTEHCEYFPGSPTLLRDSDTGQFGSYPSFEGDGSPDNPWYDR